MDSKENERIKELITGLANAINSVFSESKEIREALKVIEEEGYHVDLVLASVTRVLKGGQQEAQNSDIKYEFNNFDKSFLKAVKIKLDSEQ
ncbi:MAG: hypothetical protein HY034_06250 [Nitrospirae bacterium]|nr:hypothetical protein [Nitrospirota bacterium]